MPKITRFKFVGEAPSQYQFERADLGELVFVPIAERRRRWLSPLVRAPLWAAASLGMLGLADAVLPMGARTPIIPLWLALLLIVLSLWALNPRRAAF